MNNEEVFNVDSNANVYHASSNLNTAMENPNVNIGNATDINIKDPLEVSNNNSLESNNNINNNYEQEVQSNDEVLSYQSNTFQEDVNTPYNDNVYYPDDTQNNDVNDNNHQNNSSESIVSKFAGYTNLSSRINFQPDGFITDNIDTSSQEVNFNNSEVNEVSNHQEVIQNVSVEDNNKKRNNKIVISKELRNLIVIVIVLVLFISVMPYIYDFFKDLQLIVTG